MSYAGRSEDSPVVLEGLSASELFNSGFTAYTYDDIGVLPQFIPSHSSSPVSLKTRIGQIVLNTPMVSSPMDTVTEHRMAIALALAGGLGIVHNNCAVEEQLEEVKKVKRFCQGLITAPLVLGPTDTVEKIDEIISTHGFSTIPIVDENKKFLGMVTSRDIDFISDRSTPISLVMTPKDNLLVCDAKTSLGEAQTMLIASKKNAMPMVDSCGRLCGLITRSDCKKTLLYPLATRDGQSRLVCGAAISTRPEDFGRAQRLVLEAEVDVLVVDSSQGNSAFQLDLLRKIKEFLTEHRLSVTLVAGNVVTSSQAASLAEAGADGLRVGMGSGSICTTQEVCAVGRAQGSAVYAVCQAVKQKFPQVAVIADGGIRNFRDIGKALVLGADAVMVGSFVAGCTETPGEVFFQDGKRFKVYRGMGSLEAQMKLSGERYFYTSGVKVAQGVSGAVADKGSVHDLVGGVRRDLQGWLGRVGVAETLHELREAVDRGAVRFELNSH